MRRFTTLFLATVIALTAFGAAQAADVVSLSPQTTGLNLEVGDDEIIHVRVSEVRIDGVEIDGAEWAFVRVPSAQNSMQRGLPSLPYLTSRYLLERTGGVSLELVSRKVRSIDLAHHGYTGVVPSKGHFNRETDPATVPWVFDDKVYASDGAYPTADSRVGDPFISGPIRGQAIQIPVVHWQADTNTLTVVEEAWYRVVHVAKAANPRLGPDRPRTTPFEAVIQTNTLNAEVFTSRSNPFVETGRLLIIADDDFIDEVQPLADWEHLVGYPTLLVPVSTIGSTAAEIKGYIQSVYDTPEGLTWIILVGDSDQIPTLSGVNEGADCDACYTKLDGTDNRPDAAISRISAQTGEQVTVQVNKILDYERYPDTGGAGSWYSKGFGVAFDGGSPPDYERMNYLRDDLLTPAYTYTEFDQIYDPTATAADVTTAVNAGRSLGLYIGHGSKTSWGTTGFSVSHINTDLTNAETLPVIWSVACVNGDFVGGSDCFGEAWLKKDGGGAVSFEGATTNEDWVPPCVAQRGIVDSIRLETAFTTGGQHMAGKHHIMDEYGDAGSSSGTMWVEQSTLFGAATTWMRTLPAVTPDEPEDFVSGGGTATLTVTVGGAPLAKAGGAIVSFYNEVGGVNVVGSGLIDANGVVSAAVNGDPTHCHIHGQNLVPMSFELAAREEGRVSLDAAAYSCTGTVSIRVSDSNVTGSSPATIDATTAELTVGGSPFVATLTELAADRNIYVGTVVLGSDLAVAHGDTLTATYIDADDGAGGIDTPRIAQASADCQGPVITNIQANATQSSVTFSFTTDEPGTTVVAYGTSTPPTTIISDAALTTDHQITLDDVVPCTTLFFRIRSTDALGNTRIDNNGGDLYSVETAGWGTFLSEDFDADPGWTIDNGGQLTGGWAFGQPTGQGQDTYGQPDPTAGATGDNVYGVNLQGDAPANLTDNQLKLTTPTLDLTAATSAQLRFQRWLGVERDVYDHARIFLSIDGGASWQMVWQNGSSTIDDAAWTEETIELSAAVGQSQVQIRWTYGATDGFWNYSGWNIDDVVVEGEVPCGAINMIFDDDFEVGSCGAWSMTVGEN